MTTGRVPGPPGLDGVEGDVDVVVIGAGPQGLAVALHLLAADPTLRSRLAVIDPAGDWLSGWEQSFARLDISTLRSPGVHHPGLDPYALSRYGLDHRLPPGRGDYALPATATFTAFCRHLVAEAGLEGMVRAARAHRLTVGGTSSRVVIEADGQRLVARRAVIATNPHRRVLPPWLAGLVPLGRHQLAHSDDVDLRPLQLDGERVVVIGGGLSAAHLAVGAARRGARVHLVANRPLTVRPFDVEAGWLGPRHLDAYRREPAWDRRLAAARQARGGGSIPRWMVEELEGCGVVVHAPARVRAVGREPDRARLHLADGTVLRADRVWFATGTEPSISACRLLGPLADDLPLCGDLPVVDADLRLGPWPLWVAGRLALLELGPAAGNLWGARQAGRRIARSLTGVDPGEGVVGVADVSRRRGP